MATDRHGTIGSGIKAHGDDVARLRGVHRGGAAIHPGLGPGGGSRYLAAKALAA